MNKSPKYWVACSGGVDSVVLLHLMCEEKKDVGILHCNFHLREQSSDADEVFVRKLAEQLNVPIRVKEFDTLQYSKHNKVNTQLAARELRYNWFDEVIQKENGTVLLGHHYDDQMETFFLQLRRGGKVKGLAGMPVFRDGYLRPILKYTKKELISLAKKHNWKWHEDITNVSNDYTRNWYRNDVLPWLKAEGFPLAAIVPLMHSFQKVLAFLRTLIVPNTITINEWISLPNWVKEHFLSEQGLGEYSVNEIDRLTKAEKGKFIGNELASVWNEGADLVFVKENKNSYKYELEMKTQSIEDAEMNLQDLFLDASKVKGQLSTRKWRAGDHFQPLGMKGEKTIAKFLRDRKVPAHQKEDIQLLITDAAHILGVFGFGVSEKFKVDANTKQIICASIVKTEL